MNWLSNPFNRVWAVLATATLISYAIGEQSAGHALPTWAVATVFMLAWLKGWLVIDVFMGLRNAPKLWRRVVLGWLIGVTATLTIISVLT